MSKQHVSADSCSVCLDTLTKDLSALPCGHVFHTVCSLEALEHSPRCPVCKAKAPPDDVITLFFSVCNSSTNAPDSPSHNPHDAINAVTTHYQNIINSLERTKTKLQHDFDVTARERDAATGKVSALTADVTLLKQKLKEMETVSREQIAGLKLDNSKLKKEVDRLKEETLKVRRTNQIQEFMDIIESPNTSEGDVSAAVSRLAHADLGLSNKAHLAAVTRTLTWTKKEMAQKQRDLQTQITQLQQQILRSQPPRSTKSTPIATATTATPSTPSQQMSPNFSATVPPPLPATEILTPSVTEQQQQLKQKAPKSGGSDGKEKMHRKRKAESMQVQKSPPLSPTKGAEDKSKKRRSKPGFDDLLSLYR